jgi:hypothetical protein
MSFILSDRKATKMCDCCEDETYGSAGELRSAVVVGRVVEGAAEVSDDPPRKAAALALIRRNGLEDSATGVCNSRAEITNKRRRLMNTVRRGSIGRSAGTFFYSG